MATNHITPADSEAVIVARHALELAFSEADVARMRELAEKSREGRLTPTEREELDNFVKVGDLLAVLQSKARKLLKQPTSECL